MSLQPQEIGSPPANSEIGAEFWKDLSDDVLEDIYKQLDHPVDIDRDWLDENSGNWRRQSQSGQIIGLQDSNNNITLVKTENPLTLSSGLNLSSSQSGSQTQQIALPTFNQLPATAQRVRARSVIEQAFQLIAAQDQQITQMKQAHAQLSTNPNKADKIKELQEQQTKLGQQIETGIKELKQLNVIQVLEADDLHQSKTCIQKLHIQQIENDLLKQELNQISVPLPNAQIPAALVITEQPIPQVIFKSKSMDDAFTVQLFTSPCAEIQSTTKVKAKLVSEEPNWKVDNPIENDEVALDAYHKLAKFNHFKIHISTRMSMVKLRFTATVTPSKGAVTPVQSEGSSPFIVITNESQWCEAAGKLLNDDAFSGQAEVSWPQFANTLHHHFLKATRQESSRPARALNPLDFHYIHSKFFGGGQVVTIQQATQFWTWFGQVTQTLRFKRHINNLWFNGLIHGIITKEECNMALLNQDLGTFMIRFSETYPGLFAVAYVSDDPYERVKHYLVKPEDTGSQKTLPDFLREKPQFQCIYQYEHHTGMLRRYPKDTVLSPYYSKTKRIQAADNGYVLL